MKPCPPCNKSCNQGRDCPSRVVPVDDSMPWRLNDLIVILIGAAALAIVFFGG